MPVNRSPPGSPLPVISVTESDNITSPSVRSTPHDSSLHQCASAPDLSLDYANVTDRKKKKVVGIGDTAPVELTRTMLATFSSRQETQFEGMMLKINNIIEQNIELKLSVEVMSAKYDEFLNRISSLEAEKKEDKKLIRQLEDKIEYLERNTRATEIEIRNVPKCEGETKDDLCDMVVNLGETLNLNISQNSLKDIHRVKSKDSSNPIIVKFNSVIAKDKVIKGVKMFNKTKDKGEKLNTTHLKLKNKQPIYVSERLTFNTQKLYYLARTQHKNYGYDFCWTSYGVIYMRKKVGDPQIRINSEEDFQRLRPASCL